MAAVDFYAPGVEAQGHVTLIGTSQPGGEAPAQEFMCNACNEAFQTAAEQRIHCKCERHVYNTKRRLAGLKPISQEAWERKLREARGADASGPSKGTAHLKAGKANKKGSSSSAGNSSSTGAVGGEEPGSESVRSEAAADTAAKEDEGPFTPRRCLFDRKKFKDVDQCLEYMWKTYDFCIPDREYCTDVTGLLDFMWHKVAEPPHACLYCGRVFVDAVSCRRHMLDLRHTRIGTEARTRAGGISAGQSEEMKAELADFYDFTASTREVTERIPDADKVGCILRFFDADRDGMLRFSELSELWAAAGNGSEFSEAMYRGACSRAGASPEEGLDEEAMAALYSQGLADLSVHFKVLQDLLAKKLSNRAKEKQAIAEGEEGNEEEADKDEDSSEDDDGVDVLECEDEDEFEEVMRVLGLQKVTILENGDLRLPGGGSAVHRDVAHIWKQRGTRTSQLDLGGGRGQGKRGILPMLGNSPGGTTMAISRRAQVKAEKQYIAIVASRQKYDMQLGVKQNNLQKKKTKIRTGMGDASGGR